MFKLNNEYVIVVKRWYGKFINEGPLKKANQILGKAHFSYINIYCATMCQATVLGSKDRIINKTQSLFFKN